MAAGGAALVTAAPEPKTTERIHAELDRHREPRFDPSRRDDTKYRDGSIAELDKVQRRRAELIGELLKIAPEHEALPRPLSQRWNVLKESPVRQKELAGEFARVN